MAIKTQNKTNIAKNLEREGEGAQGGCALHTDLTRLVNERR